MRLSSIIKRLALAVLLIWISTGCYVPIKNSSPGYRKYLPATRRDFTPGKTTRTEILLKMGEPDECSPDETLLKYRWLEQKGVVIGGCAPSPPITAKTSFFFTFDDRGILKSLDITFDD